MITTLWKVDDRTSYELVRAFYARLESAIQKLMNRHPSDALGERGRARDIDEEEEPLLGARSVVSAEYPVAQGPAADDLADLEHEDERHGRSEREDHGHESQRPGADRNPQEAGPGLHDVDEGDHRAVDEPFDEQRDGKRRLLDDTPRVRAASN